MNILTRIRKIPPPVYRRLGGLTATVLTSVVPQLASAQKLRAANSDTAALSAILKAAAAESRQEEFQVDPRPLRANPNQLYEVEPGVLARVTDRILRQREAVINSVGLRTADTALLNASRSCPGSLVASPLGSPPAVERPVSGCPPESLIVLTVGPPRRGTAVLPSNQAYDRDRETARIGYWSARVIRTSVRVVKMHAFAADYVLAKRAGRWEVIKVVSLMYSE